MGDGLAAAHRVAALHHDVAVVGVGRDPAVGVADEDEVAVAGEFVAGVDHGAGLGGLDRRAFRHREVDAVVALAVRLGAEAGDDAAAHRPAERLAVGGGGVGGVVDGVGARPSSVGDVVDRRSTGIAGTSASRVGAATSWPVSAVSAGERQPDLRLPSASTRSCAERLLRSAEGRAARPPRPSADRRRRRSRRSVWPVRIAVRRAGRSARRCRRPDAVLRRRCRTECRRAATT